MSRYRLRIAMLLLAASTSAAAEQTGSQTLLDCADLSGASERLACYDRVAGRAEREPATSEPAAVAREREPDTPISAVAASIDAPAAAPSQRRLEQAADAAPVAADALARRDFGLEPAPSESISVRVVALRETRSGTAIFTTQDDQVWRQTSTRTRHYPPVPFEARIEPGAAGSFFLVPEAGGRAVRVIRRD